MAYVVAGSLAFAGCPDDGDAAPAVEDAVDGGGTADGGDSTSDAADTSPAVTVAPDGTVVRVTAQPCANFRCDVVGPNAEPVAATSVRWFRGDEQLDETAAVLVGGVATGDRLRCVATIAAVGDVASPEHVVELPSLAIASVTILPGLPQVGDVLTCAPFGISTGTCPTQPTLVYRWHMDGAELPGVDSVTLDSTDLPAGASLTCGAFAEQSGNTGPTTLSPPVTLAAVDDDAPVVALDAPDGADGMVSCVVGDDAGFDLAAIATWHWQINDREAFEGGTTLATDDVRHCDVVRCWVEIPQTGAQLRSNVAELQLSLGDDCGGASSCTSPACHPAGGCANSANNGMACDDDDACSTGGVCADGTCLGTPVVCASGDPCMSSYCAPGVGCVDTPASGNPCDDGDDCTSDDHCEAGVCLGTPSCSCTSDAECATGSPCATGACVDGSCTAVPTTAACDDGDPCTSNDACVEGVCQGTAAGGQGYVDSDGDGFGGAAVEACPGQDGVVDVAGDCDDSDAAISPNATEAADDGVDANCDGVELFAGNALTLAGPIGGPTYNVGISGPFDLGELGVHEVSGTTSRAAGGPVSWCVTAAVTRDLGAVALDAATVTVCRNAAGTLSASVSGPADIGGFSVAVSGSIGLGAAPVDYDFAVSGAVLIEGTQGNVIEGAERSFARRTAGVADWRLELSVGTLPLSDDEELNAASLALDPEGTEVTGLITLGAGASALTAIASGPFEPSGPLELALALPPGESNTWSPFGDVLPVVANSLTGTLVRNASGIVTASVLAPLSGDTELTEDITLKAAELRADLLDAVDEPWQVRLEADWDADLGDGLERTIRLIGTVEGPLLSLRGQVTGEPFEPMAALIGQGRFEITGTDEDPFEVRLDVHLIQQSVTAFIDAYFSLCLLPDCAIEERAEGAVHAIGQFRKNVGFRGLIRAQLQGLELPLLGPMPDMALVGATSFTEDVDLFDDGTAVRHVPFGLTVAVRAELPFRLEQIEQALFVMSVERTAIRVDAELGLNLPFITPDLDFPGIDHAALAGLGFYAELRLAGGCPEPIKPLPVNPLPNCADGVDNDGDGAVDGQDAGCTDPDSLTESPECDDGIDNDGDGDTDMLDTACINGSDDTEGGEPEPLVPPTPEPPDDPACAAAGSRMGVTADVTFTPEGQTNPLVGTFDGLVTFEGDVGASINLLGLWTEPFGLRNVAVQNPAFTAKLNFAAAGFPVLTSLGWNLDVFWKKSGDWPPPSALDPSAANVPENVVKIGSSFFFDKLRRPVGFCVRGRCAVLPPILYRFELHNLSLDDMVAFANDTTRAMVGPLAGYLPTAELEPIDLSPVTVDIDHLVIAMSTHTLNFFGQPFKSGVFLDVDATVMGKQTQLEGSLSWEGLVLRGQQDALDIPGGLTISGDPLWRELDVSGDKQLQLPDDDRLDIDSGAVELWIKGSDFCTGGSARVMEHVSGAGDGLTLDIAQCDDAGLAAIALTFSSGGVTRAMVTDHAVPSGEDVHLALAFDATRTGIYVDGERIPLVSDTRPGGAVTLAGQWVFGGTGGLSGVDVIDDIRIWSTAPNPDALISHARRLPTRYINPLDSNPSSPLVARYEFDYGFANTRYRSAMPIGAGVALSGATIVERTDDNPLQIGIDIPNPLVDLRAPGFSVSAGAELDVPALLGDDVAFAVKGKFADGAAALSFEAPAFELMALGLDSNNTHLGTFRVGGFGRNLVDDQGGLDDGVYGELDFANGFYAGSGRFEFVPADGGAPQRYAEGTFAYDHTLQYLHLDAELDLTVDFAGGTMGVTGTAKYNEPEPHGSPVHELLVSGDLVLFGQSFAGIDGTMTTEKVSWVAGWTVPLPAELSVLSSVIPTTSVGYEVSFVDESFCGFTSVTAAGVTCDLQVCFFADRDPEITGCEALGCPPEGCPLDTVCTSSQICASGLCDGVCVECRAVPQAGCNFTTEYCELGRCLARRGLGQTCGFSDQCQSNTCSGGVCKTPCSGDAGCATNQFCDLVAGVCEPKAANDEPCVDDNVCLSDVCAGVSCQDCRNAPTAKGCNFGSQYCEANVCKAKKPLGQGCGFDDQCQSGKCSGGVCKTPCSNDSGCSSTEFCDLVAGVCAPEVPNGDPCVDDNVCQSDVCAGTACRQCRNAPNQKGCNFGSQYCEGNVCKAKKSTGQSCSFNDQCQSNTCVGGTCKTSCSSDANCSGSQWCDLVFGACEAKKSNNTGCSNNNQCTSGLCGGVPPQCRQCLGNGNCGGSQYCEGFVCKNKKANGQSCGFDDQCQSNKCSGGTCKTSCSSDANCSSSQWCDLVFGACEAKKSNNTGCSNNNQCSSGVCGGLPVPLCRQCLSNANCGGNQYCEGFVCKNKKANGQDCGFGDQCTSGLCGGLPAKCRQCLSNANCGSNQYCSGFVCNNKKSNGQSCVTSSWCTSNCCVLNVVGPEVCGNSGFGIVCQ